MLPKLLSMPEIKENNTGEFSFESIKQGNISEYEALFRKFYPSMCIVAMRFVRDQAVAEDLVQEVFVRLWTKKAAYEQIPNLRTFLYVAVKNLCFNYLRDKKDTIDYTSREVVEQEECFRSAMLEEEAYRLVTEAVDKLPLQSARIIRLALEGRQNKEIAEMLGVSVNTVKTLKYNAISALRDSLKEHYCLLVIILCQK